MAKLINVVVNDDKTNIICVDMELQEEASVTVLKQFADSEELEKCSSCGRAVYHKGDDDFGKRVYVRVIDPLSLNNINASTIMVKCKHCDGEGFVKSALEYGCLPEVVTAVGAVRERFMKVKE